MPASSPPPVPSPATTPTQASGEDIERAVKTLRLHLNRRSDYGTLVEVLDEYDRHREPASTSLDELRGVHSWADLANACNEVYQHGEEGTTRLWASSLMMTAASIFAALARGVTASDAPAPTSQPSLNSVEVDSDSAPDAPAPPRETRESEQTVGKSRGDSVARGESAEKIRAASPAQEATPPREIPYPHLCPTCCAPCVCAEFYDGEPCCHHDACECAAPTPEASTEYDGECSLHMDKPVASCRVCYPPEASAPEPSFVRWLLRDHEALRDLAQHTESGVGGCSAEVARQLAALLADYDALHVARIVARREFVAPEATGAPEPSDERLLEVMQDSLRQFLGVGLVCDWGEDLPPSAIDATLAVLHRLDSLRATVAALTAQGATHA
jgi:hypothetical protein